MTLGLVPISTLRCIIFRFSFSFLCFKRRHLSYPMNPYAIRACAVGLLAMGLQTWRYCWVLCVRYTISWYITNYKFLVHYSHANAKLHCHVGECITPTVNHARLQFSWFCLSNMTELKRLVRMNSGILGGGVPPGS